MYPAFSVIFFTTASGAGYGLLALLGLLAPLGLLPADRLFGAVALFVALGGITAGLLASTLHLGHPERAWRAVSQWRTSWLSREGVAAIVTYIPAGIFAIGWVIMGEVDGLWALAGLASSVGAVATVYCTAMIYRSLKPIQRWHNGYVPPLYLSLSLMSGLVLLVALTTIFGCFLPLFGWLAFASILLGAIVKLAYWRFIDGSSSPSTAESATGLGKFGKVRLFEAPHTEENYLLKEMGYKVGRKHAAKLRRISLAFGFAVPLALVLVALLVGGWMGAVAALLAAPSAGLGILAGRWLFFAEARHTVTLYYGAATA